MQTNNEAVLREVADLLVENNWRGDLAEELRDMAAALAATATVAMSEHEAGRIMQSTHALCPSDLSHPEKMRWMAKRFIEKSGAATVAKDGGETKRERDLDASLDRTMADRDQYHEWADKLAGAIAEHFGADIGEHSNLNCPWSEALDVIGNAPTPHPEASAEQPAGEQKVYGWALWHRIGAPELSQIEPNADTYASYDRVVPLYAAPVSATQPAGGVPVDPVVEKVREALLARSQLGIKKYGDTLHNMDYSEREILQHAIEESMDLSNYLMARIMKIDSQVKVCTCPSGDGSLRWPCPQHPPLAAPISEDAGKGETAKAAHAQWRDNRSGRTPATTGDALVPLPPARNLAWLDKNAPVKGHTDGDMLAHGKACVEADRADLYKQLQEAQAECWKRGARITELEAARPVPATASIGEDAKFGALLDWLLDAYKSGKKADLERFNEGVQEFVAYIDTHTAASRNAGVKIGGMQIVESAALPPGTMQVRQGDKVLATMVNMGTATTAPDTSARDANMRESLLEEAAQACEGERVEETGSEGDLGYNMAIKHAAEAIRALKQAAPVGAMTDTKRIDWFDKQGTAYGFEDIQEGNEWVMNGPFPTLRKAIDACMADESKGRAS